MDNDNRPPVDQINIKMPRRDLLRIAGTVLGGAILAACGETATPLAATTAPAAPGLTPTAGEGAATDAPAAAGGGARGVATSEPTDVSEGGKGLGPTADTAKQTGPTAFAEDPTAANLDNPTAAATATTGPDAAPQQSTAVAVPTEGAPTEAAVDSIPETDDKEGRIVALNVRIPLDEQVGHMVEVRYLVQPHEVSLRDGKAIAESQVLKDMSRNIAGFVVNMLDAELSLEHGVLSAHTSENIDLALNNFTKNIDAVLQKQKPLEKSPEGADAYDWKKPDVKSRYTPPENNEGIFFNEDDPAIAANGGVVAEVIIYKRKGAEAVIGSKGDKEGEGKKFKEALGILSHEAAKMAGEIVDKGQLNPDWFAGHTRWLDAIKEWTEPTPTS